jgi:hypothetical protein
VLCLCLFPVGDQVGHLAVSLEVEAVVVVGNLRKLISKLSRLKLKLKLNIKLNSNVN